MKSTKALLFFGFVAGICGVAHAQENGSSVFPSTGVYTSTGTCTGEHIVQVKVVNNGRDEILGGLESGGSSGFVEFPSATSSVSLSSTSGVITAVLQAYEQTGVPYPENYHTIDVQCKTIYNFAKSCNSDLPVTMLEIYEGQTGKFICLFKRAD